ncbi:Zn-ribbon domain-containing OB-fold protein [Mycolicibacterium llatzerense]|uniref:ChsH2 C-terminal OB-fold domain-containing protein n=1 Tax=Mycolicibacterium llatzerense TaxID=280871 RepID=A0A0D1LCA9_9MYCO|nr:OB-fold domain-containing protein [Mycolicibacterium llatzerense]KIU15882.1 hypothetical protein TL10_16420 [Mycolicibacterium llatzerense]
MSAVVSIGTYLPPWQVGGKRVTGPDEDAVTMAVAAGRAADPAGIATRVVLVSRDFPLLEGGNGAVLLAGLSLPAEVAVTEVLGGAPTVLDLVAEAFESTLLIAVDESGGAAALLTGTSGPRLRVLARRSRSLPTVARGRDGVRHVYGDARLERNLGVQGALAQLNLSGPGPVVGIVGAKAAQLDSQWHASAAITEFASSGAAVLRSIAEGIERRAAGWIVAVEQSSVTVAELSLGQGSALVVRDEPPARELPPVICSSGTGIPISLAAYARAFESKLRWEAAIFAERPGIEARPVFPPRVRVDSAGELVAPYGMQPLPRTGTVYTHTTVRIAVPDLPGPYSLAVVQLDESPVRVLLKVTGVAAGEVAVGQSGAVVFRRIAVRTGIPDYGYAFWPGKQGVAA